MADPVFDSAPLEDSLSALLGRAFATLDLDPALGVVRPADRPDLAPFQCNGALAGAKAAGRKPRDIAEGVVAAIAGDPLLERVEIAGPGFINLTPSQGALTARANALAADPRAGALTVETARRVIIDFGGPNVAKAMHVGHLRSTIIGDALQRLFRFRGDHVVSDVHLGDWGLQMGQIIVGLKHERPDLPYFGEAFEGAYPEQSPVTMEDLQDLYPRASAACKEDPARLAEAQDATRALQQGRPGYLALWRHFLNVSVEALKRDFARLGVEFDLWKGESDADPLIPEMAEQLKRRGVAVEDQGALVIPIAEEGDRKELPPLILLKSDGAALYSTTDLATILERVRFWAPDLILYVVDKRQGLHFEQVFRAARRAGFVDRTGLEHIAYGTMNGPDGKPFKTRAGGVLKLSDLIGQAQGRALERMKEAGLAEELSPEERDEVALQIGLAAVKFADLSHDRATDYIFDLDRFMTFEGKTGPYLLYAAVRVKSLMRRAAEQSAAAGPIDLQAPEERALALALDAFERALRNAYDKRAPNFLTDHAYSLAQAFSAFYAACPVLAAEDAAVRGSRLALAALTLKQLEIALDLLGLQAPEQM
jgi:arginyl-tRNA synthetase